MTAARELFLEPRITTTDVALDAIEDLKRCIRALESEIRELKKARDALKSEDARILPPEDIEQLEKISAAIRRGTVNDDHRYELDKILSWLR